jgi:hypothetical protein
MLIRIRIEGTQPLAGTAATKGSKPLRFDGWLELLRVVSELVAAAEKPMQEGHQGHDCRHPGSPAGE